MDNPVLVEMINDLPLLLRDPDLVQRLLDHAHARLDHYAVLIDLATAVLEELRETPMATEEDNERAVQAAAAGFEAFQRQSRNMTQIIAFLLAVQAFAYARSRSRLVPGVLLAAASAAVVPGFRTFVRFSVLMLGFLFASS